MTFFHAFILGIIEGITEFLPISSTGHLILAVQALGISKSDFITSFEISIQVGALIAIALLYMRALVPNISNYLKLFLAFVPIAIVGLSFYDFIKDVLFHPYIVASSLIFGGIILLFFEKERHIENANKDIWQSVTYTNALVIGLFQCLAVIPGTSRAAATIIGGMVMGLSKAKAAEFSFLLAVPTILAASGYDLLKTWLHFTWTQWGLIAFGSIVSAVSAYVAVKIFMKLIPKGALAFFGFYRIILGIITLIFLWQFGIKLDM